MIDLDQLRAVGDLLADNAVAAYFAQIDSAQPGNRFGQLARHVHLPSEDQNPAIRYFLTEASRRPEWVDEGRIVCAQRFFNSLVAHQFSALYLASLPNSYAAAKGVQVLHLTGRLQNDTQRRLNETAQLLMNIAVPGAMDVGGKGIDQILHVRLMHAAVRWMIEHDPSVTHVNDVKPPVVGDGLMWSRSWGVPINQEDLLGTWLTFTSVVYDAFDASGVDYTGRDVADHLHFWRLVGHHLGIDPGLVPQTRDGASALRLEIFGRQQAPSAAGVAMTAALFAQAHSHMPRFAWPLMPTAFRHFLGDQVADMIGVPALFYVGWMAFKGGV